MKLQFFQADLIAQMRGRAAVALLQQQAGVVAHQRVSREVCHALFLPDAAIDRQLVNRAHHLLGLSKLIRQTFHQMFLDFAGVVAALDVVVVLLEF